MSEQNEKLTANAKDFIFELLEMKLDAEYGNVTGKDEVLKELINWHAQQVEHATAELRKALNFEHGENVRLSNEINTLKTQLAEAQRQRDECIYAMKELDRIKKEGSERESFLIALVEKLLGCGTFSPYDNVGVVKQAKEYLSRLSSGETKQEAKCPICRKGDWVIVTNGNGEKSNRCFECGAESLTDNND